jgi:bacterioferritin-associated ferredoxin
LNTQKKIIEGIRKICICKGVPASTISEAIRGGSLSFEALRRTIGVGTGNCKARRCRAKIEKMVKDHKESLVSKKSLETEGQPGFVS